MGDKHIPISGDRLSGKESQILLEHLSSATSQEVPLSEVFRALAEDASEPRLRRVATHLADQLEKGTPFEDAITSASTALPPHMKRALAIGEKTGNLPGIVAGLSDSELARRQMKLGLRSVLSYPFLVFGFLSSVMLLFAVLVVPYFREIYEDFELDLPAMTIYTLQVAELLPKALLVFFTFVAIILVIGLFFTGGRFIHWFRTALPLIGRPWVWSSQHEFSTLMSNLTQNDVPLSTALDCTAESLRDRNLAWAAQHVNGKCKSGMLLGDALQESIHFDHTLTALVEWGESHQTLPLSLKEAAQHYEQEMQHYVQFLHRIMPPLMLTIVASTLFLVICSLMIPLVELINGLTG